MTNNLKLEIGKSYIDGHGYEIDIVEEEYGVEYPFSSTWGMSYTEDGKHLKLSESKSDLVSEAIVPPPVVDGEVGVRYVLGEITKWSDGSAVTFRYVDVHLDGGEYGPSTRRQTLELPEAAAIALCAGMMLNTTQVGSSSDQAVGSHANV